MASLSQQDPEVYRAIMQEQRRLEERVHLIASENAVSEAVLEATGSVLTQKYAEGLPGKRYYQGCEWIDVVESLAIDRAKELFGADHANVQPHSGSQANISVYFATLKPGDHVLAMDLREGGHLTHGSPVNFSGLLYHFDFYGVDHSTGRLDYDGIAALARQHRPKLIVAGATAYPRIIDFPRFRAIADEVGAVLMVDMAHIAGLIAGGVHPSPVPYADFVSSSTHKTLRGPRGGFVLCKKTHAANLDRAVFPGVQGGPLEHVIAAKAVAFGEALSPAFREYQQRVVDNARALAESLVAEGLNVVSGGTENHLMLVDLGSNGPTGREVADALDRCGIVANKNSVPGDRRPPTQTSGIRLGTPAATTAGFRPNDMLELGQLIAGVIKKLGDDAVYAHTRQRVARLCAEARGRMPGGEGERVAASHLN